MKSGSSGLFKVLPTRRLLCILALCLGLTSGSDRLGAQQTFSSGSDGSDGIYAPTGPSGTIIVFDPAQFHGSQVSANIFNFVNVTIPAGVTIKFVENVLSGPVTWLVQGDVFIQGTIDLSGAKGHDYTTNPFALVPAVPGSGGYAGGLGGSLLQAPTSGSGPSGGAAGLTTGSGNATSGSFTGNQFLIPLVGGSGGGGSNLQNGVGGTFGAGGGAGGGAILIASSTKITLTGGSILANGGAGGSLTANPCPFNIACSGGGAGGAIRLVANTISGTGTLSVAAGSGAGAATAGVIRLEAYTNTTFGGGSIQRKSTPLPLLINTSGPATAKVISINGVAVTPNPSGFPDITINTTAAIPVVVQTHNVPSTATITLTVLNENYVANTTVSAPIGSCDGSNTCLTTLTVVFPYGAARGITRVTWTQ